MRNLMWFRNDLRVADNPALSAAMDKGEVIALYLVSAEQWCRHDMGDRRIAFQIRTLTHLEQALDKLGIPMLIRDAPLFSDAPQLISDVCRKLDIGRVFFNREYPLNERRRDEAVRRTLEQGGLGVESHTADVVIEPGDLRTGKGDPYTVFTPFFRRWRVEVENQAPLPVPATQNRPDITSEPVAQTWDGVSAENGSDLWEGGEAKGLRMLDRFAQSTMARYEHERDLPAQTGTSRLSPYLAVGAISPRQCLSRALQAATVDATAREGAEKWIAELAWRDFYRHIVALFDHVNTGSSFKRDLNHLPWRQAPEELAAWQAGETGYPLVDAGMRELSGTGWMHNRVRMVVAMFLTKHLLIDWRAGERYFMHQLIDGDFASNNGGWQWSASTGTDAAPYFRIFNPVSQAEKCDPEEIYIDRWAPDSAARKPIVEHRFARERALAFFKANR